MSIPYTMPLRDPPTHVRASFGLMGAVGVVINMIFFILDIISDALLAFVLWTQAEKERWNKEPMTWFIITICIIIIPMIIINIISIIWYNQNKQCLGDYCVLHKMSKCDIAITIFMHLILLGPLMRYIDIVRYGGKMVRYTREVEMSEYGESILRRTPKGEVYAVLQMVMSRDTAMLDMIHSFLQDAPQLIFQIFLLYRSPEIATNATIAVQICKILLGVLSISWSLVSYQDQLRCTVIDKKPLSCCGLSTCVMWRAAMVASRVIAIGSFTAIYPPNDEHRFFSIYMRDDGTLYIPFTIISMCVLTAHWLIMTAWIHAQGTNFCSDDDSSKHPILELMYNCIMGIVHIFCYINVKDTPSRRRMAFYYTFCLIENTAMIAVWCVEMEPTFLSVWFRATVVFSVELLWVIGLCCIIGYYAFLHPDKDNIPANTTEASWRR